MASTDRSVIQRPAPDLRGRQTRHESAQITILQWPENEVPVIGQQTIAENTNEDLPLRLGHHLLESRVIRGRITSNGKPVADREIRSRSVDAGGSLAYDPKARTASDGTFELKCLRPGKHYVQADPLHIPAEIDPKGYKIVDVKAGAVVDNVNLDFKGN